MINAAHYFVYETAIVFGTTFLIVSSTAFVEYCQRFLS